MARAEDLVSSEPLTSDQLARAGRDLAAAQDAALDARDRPPLDARLASLRKARARRASPADGADRGGRLALAGGVTALAAAAAWALWVRSTAPIEFAIGPDRASGAADVSVVHRAETRWSIVSGPFEVRVIGTRFEAAWDPAEEALSLIHI